MGQNCGRSPVKACSNGGGCLVHPRCVLAHFGLGAAGYSSNNRGAIRADSWGHNSSCWGLVNIITCEWGTFGHQVTVVQVSCC